MLSLTTIPGIPEGVSVATVVLILLLLFRDFFPISRLWRDDIKVSLNMGIIPLLFVFGAAILFKIIELF